MNIKLEIINAIKASLQTLNYPGEPILEIPKDLNFGDYSTNIAMQLAGQLNKSPFDIANSIIENLPTLEFIKEIEVVKPGFINIKIKEFQ